MVDDEYCQSRGYHVPHVGTGRCIYCGKKELPLGERIALWLTVLALFGCMVFTLFDDANAAETNIPKIEQSYYEIWARFFSVADGTPTSDILRVHLEKRLETIQECNEFLISTGPQKPINGSYVILWCHKVGPDDKQT